MNMISKINSTPLKELPDQDLHEKMFFLQNDIDDYLSENIINEKIESFKQTMRTEQNVIVTTTHRNSLIQAEIETKEEYLRLNQGSGESVLDMKNKNSNNENGLQEEGLSAMNKNMNEINDNDIYRNNKMYNKEDDNTDKIDNKMKSKFEGLKDYLKPKGEKKKRTPDENSQLNDVKNSVSADFMKELEEFDDFDDNNKIDNNDDDNDDDENSNIEGDDDKGNQEGEKKKEKNEEISRREMINTKVNEARKREQKERLEKMEAMKKDGYLIGWG